MQWLITDTLNVIPLEDYRPHDNTEACWCTPRRDPDEPRVIVHNSLDGREQYERGELQLQ